MRGRALAAAAAASAAALNAPPVFAQTTEPQRIEITASEETDNDRRRREPVARSIYGREELDRHGDSNVTDVLKRLPGVTLQGGAPRLRGLGAGYTLILVNGEPAPPGFSLDNLSPAMVERIEILKGPSAETSAQAVAGSINIVLREAPRQRQRELRFGTSYQVARAVPWANLLLADRFGAWSATLPVSLYQWSGGQRASAERDTFDRLGDPQRLDSASEDRWAGYGFSASPRLQWKAGERTTLDWQSFVQRNQSRNDGGTRTTVESGLPPPSVDDRYDNRGHWHMLRSGVALTQRFDAGSRLEAHIGGQASHSEFFTRLIGRDDAGRQTVERLTDGDTSERGALASAKWSLPWAEGHTLTTGAELERRRRDETRSVLENGVPQLVGYEGEPFSARVQRSAAFVQDEWELSPRWSASLGLRAERIDIESSGSDGTLENNSRVLTPMLHLNHRFTPGGKDLVRASLTRSYRAPELSALMSRPGIASSYPVNGPNTELAPDRLGNPTLRPELATGLDVALERYLPAGGIVSVGVFHRRITDLMRNRLVLIDVPWSTVPRWVSQPVNLAGARSTGLELELKGKASELFGLQGAHAKGLSLRLAAAVYRSRVEQIPGPDNRLEAQQPWSLTLGVDHQWPGLPLALGFSLASTPGYGTQLTPLQHQELSGTRSLDLSATWTFSRAAIFRFSVNNAWPRPVRTQTLVADSTGRELASDTSQWRRPNFTAGLTLRF